MEVVTILILLVLSIALPTLDTFTDINLVYKLYRGAQVCFYDFKTNHSFVEENYQQNWIIIDECEEEGPVSYCSKNENQAVCRFSSHPTMATAMLTPFLLNYIVCFITFLRKEKNKKFNFIFALLPIYPQFVAARIIYLLVKNPSEGKKKKKNFDQDIGLLETCLESVPSAFIITVIMISADDYVSLGNIIFNPHSPSLFTRIFGVPPSKSVARAEFFTTYAISVISATLGLAKCLKNGVARPIASGGPLDGLLTGKFILAFLASGVVLVARGFCIAYTVNPYDPKNGRMERSLSISLTVTILLLFVPQFLLSLFSTLNFLNKSSLKILYRQPSLIILPTVTFFTFSRVGGESRVSFSKKFSWLNILFSTVGYVVFVVRLYYNLFIRDFNDSLLTTLPLYLSSILVAALFLHLDKLPCCNPREQLSVYDPDLDQKFIMLDGRVVEDPEGEVENGTKTCYGWCRQTEKQQTERDVVITVSNGDKQSLPVAAPEVKTVEDDADTTVMTSLNTKEKHTAGGTAGEETEGKTEL